MINPVTIITDDYRRTLNLAKSIGERFRSNLTEIKRMEPSQVDSALLLVFDIDLTNHNIIELVQQKCTNLLKEIPSIFLLKDSKRLEVVQANALDASAILQAPYNLEDLQSLISSFLEQSTDRIWEQSPEVEKSALKAVDQLNDNIFVAIQSAQSLPKEEILHCGNKIAASLSALGVPSWLEAVKKHHSYTYRHSMQVTGLAVAFGLHLGMRQEDVQRLAVSALMHDVGKARIPTGLLDKAGKLKPEEIQQIRRHPELGAQILVNDGEFDYEVIDVALHHHERLDGTGYPEQLRGDEISDLVRMISVVDTFSALIDARSYKEPKTRAQAFQVMLGLEGQLDLDFVKAFEPVALVEKVPRRVAQTA